jgi:hypothetical protein
MKQLYDYKNISIIHNEHTFFVSDEEIHYLFSQYGYSCASTTSFKKHSLFYHFVYNSSIIPLTLCKFDRSIEVAKWLSEFEYIMHDIHIDRPTFICPAGHYGQKIYYYLKNHTEYIKGFIDNDMLKQGTRVYGTQCHVYPIDILKEYNGLSISCILYAGPYTNELQSQLNKIHPNINYIKLERKSVDTKLAGITHKVIQRAIEYSSSNNELIYKATECES